MSKELLHLYGPFSINSYGLMAVIAIVVTFFLINRDPLRKKLLSSEQLATIFTFSTIMGVIGGRLLHILANWNEIQSLGQIFAVWEGGLSVLGVVLAIALTLPLYLLYARIPIVPFFDVITCYAPLLESITRIGCFFAGCCFGIPSTLPWAVTYTDPACVAPLGIPLHPAQIYTALLLTGVFVLLRYVLRARFVIPGQITMLYFMLISFVRFIMDYVRWDTEYIGNFRLLTLHQCIAGIIFLTTCIWFIFLTIRYRQKNESI